MNKVYEFITDILMPNRCPCCYKVIRYNELVCKEYIKKLPIYNAEDKTVPAGCSAVICAFVYKDSAKNGVLALKKSWGYSFAEYSAKILSERLEGCGAELITSVPTTKRKLRNKGWNQADVIAKALSKEMDIPCDLKLLVRAESAQQQHELHAGERASHAREIYSISKRHKNITDKRILLVDDICTTGATFSACADLLNSLGAKDIIAVSVCRTLKER